MTFTVKCERSRERSKNLLVNFQSSIYYFGQLYCESREIRKIVIEILQIRRFLQTMTMTLNHVYKPGNFLF
jgi:hypothetical protein